MTARWDGFISARARGAPTHLGELGIGELTSPDHDLVVPGRQVGSLAQVKGHVMLNTCRRCGLPYTTDRATARCV